MSVTGSTEVPAMTSPQVIGTAHDEDCTFTYKEVWRSVILSYRTSLCNKLSPSVRSAAELYTFKSRLKTSNQEASSCPHKCFSDICWLDKALFSLCNWMLALIYIYMCWRRERVKFASSSWSLLSMLSVLHQERSIKTVTRSRDTVCLLAWINEFQTPQLNLIINISFLCC